MLLTVSCRMGRIFYIHIPAAMISDHIPDIYHHLLLYIFRCVKTAIQR